LEFSPPNPLEHLSIPEGGKINNEYWYHQIYTDGQYVYDPRARSTPIPKGDYMRLIDGLNPGLTVWPQWPTGTFSARPFRRRI
jgi:filamentous hemagglutinin